KKSPLAERCPHIGQAIEIMSTVLQRQTRLHAPPLAAVPTAKSGNLGRGSRSYDSNREPYRQTQAIQGPNIFLAELECARPSTIVIGIDCHKDIHICLLDACNLSEDNVLGSKPRNQLPDKCRDITRVGFGRKGPEA